MNKYKIVILRGMNEKINLFTVCRVHLQRDEMLVGTMASPAPLVRNGALERRNRGP